MAKSFRSHFKKATHAEAHYMKDRYTFHPYCNSKFTSSNTNMLARIQNTVATALNINKNKMGFPKYIIFVLDDDLITYLNFNREGATTLFGIWIEWLVLELNKLVQSRKDQLAKKFYKDDYLFFYWVHAPTHSFFSKDRNNLRIKFNLSLESVIKAQPNMRVIKLKDHWNSKDSTLVVNDHITEMGMSAYWAAIDATFQFNESKRELFLAKKLSIPKGPATSDGKTHCKGHGDISPRRDTTHNSGADLMEEFFARNRNYEGHRMDDREDQLRRPSFDRRHRNDRFLLLRP